MSSTIGQTNYGTGQTNKGQGESQMTHGQGGSMSQTQQHTEGMVARTIEQQTAKLPSDIFLWAAFGSGTRAVGGLPKPNLRAIATISGAFGRELD